MSPAIAGLLIPGMVFKTNFEIAINAPVFPAETSPSLFFSFTSLMAKRKLDFFSFLKASTGPSSDLTTSLV